MQFNLTPDKENNTQQPGIGVYAVILTGITKTIAHMGIYTNSDDAINHAIDHVAVNSPQLHQQVIQKKGYWDVAVQYIAHEKAVEQFNYLLEVAEPKPITVTGSNVKDVLNKVREALHPEEERIALVPVPDEEQTKPEPKPFTKEQLEALEKDRIKTEKNKKLKNLIEMGSLTALELEKDNLTQAEYQLVYEKIK
jgi:hypothetical protein